VGREKVVKKKGGAKRWAVIGLLPVSLSRFSEHQLKDVLDSLKEKNIGS